MAFAISTVSPIFILICMLYKLTVSCLEEFLFKIFVLCKFLFQTLIHKWLFNLLPIFSNRKISGITKFECIKRSLCLSYFKLEWFALEFFWLEIMFVCFIYNTVYLEWCFVKVTEQSVLIILFVKFNRMLRLGLHYKRIILI